MFEKLTIDSNSKSNEYLINKSNSNSTHLTAEAERIAKILGDSTSHFELYALTKLSHARVIALANMAVNRGKVPAKYFNKLVKNEIG